MNFVLDIRALVKQTSISFLVTLVTTKYNRLDSDRNIITESWLPKGMTLIHLVVHSC